MTEESFTADNVAAFLANNPDFFEQHAEVFASLKVPHPHKSQAISLGERQILTLRSRLKNHEQQLQSLVYNASGNQKINSALMQWCARMLAQENGQLIPDMIKSSLQEQFDLAAVVLQLWNLQSLENPDYAEQPGSKAYAEDLEKPYCGPVPDHAVTASLDENIKSVAIIPLQSYTDQQTIGLLIFGSADSERFTTDMGTEFLQLIARLSGAALSRLL